MKITLSIRLAAVSLAMVTAVGCATTDRSTLPQVTLADPATVPKEKWSDALKMFNNQMGIYGMQDSTADSSHGAAAGLVNDAQRKGYGAEMGALAQSVAAGALFFVLDSGPANRMISRPQIAFWVPRSEASSPEAASAIVAERWTAIRKQVLAGRRKVSRDQISVSGYPLSHPKAFGSVIEELKNRRPPFAENVKRQTVGSVEGEYYGPIFVHPGSTLLLDHGATDAGSLVTLLKRYAAYMPPESMLYYPGESAPKIYGPAFIMTSEGKYLFQAKP